MKIVFFLISNFSGSRMYDTIFKMKLRETCCSNCYKLLIYISIFTSIDQWKCILRLHLQFQLAWILVLLKVQTLQHHMHNALNVMPLQTMQFYFSSILLGEFRNIYECMVSVETFSNQCS